MVNETGFIQSRASDNASRQGQEFVEFAVNGTLMRGLELENNMLSVGATFLREALTAKEYRFFSIDDIHPAMIRVPAPGFEGPPVQIAVEIWRVPKAGICELLINEPAGLSIGKVSLSDGKTEVLGVIAEPALVNGKKDISNYPGNGVANFRDYIVCEALQIISNELNKSALDERRLATIRIFFHAGKRLHSHSQYRRAISILNYAIKMLNLKDRLHLNIPCMDTKAEYVLEDVLT